MLNMEYVNWVAFTAYTVGAIGGIGYLIQFTVNSVRARKVHDQYEPVEHIPVYVTKEPPISARTKV